MNSIDKPIALSPYIYEIEPTNHCPYACIMCPRGRGRMTRPRGYMSLELFEKMLTMFPADQRLVRLHHFGEAVLHPRIDTMIAMVVETGRIPVISLNPATLNESLCRRLVAAAPGLVCFSLDAFSDQGLKKIRGIRRPYEECLQLMDMFVSMSRKSSRKILKVIQTVVLDENRDQLAALAALKERYQEPDVVFYRAENTGFGDLELVEQTNAGGSAALKANARSCAAPFSEVSILWNGDVVLCCYDYNGDNVIGNLEQVSMADIWSGAAINRLRKTFTDRETARLKLCSRCYLAPHHFAAHISGVEKNWQEEQFLLQLLAAIC
ncbi:MAG: SPASM domain-containing protein [Desulfobulbaceae bacterium]|nr:SPASM domain-containing protein [Desulfobulbaceae bacterium]